VCHGFMLDEIRELEREIEIGSGSPTDPLD
jgi:hypothetical protein